MSDKPPEFVFAYHDVVDVSKSGAADYDGARCDVIYDGETTARLERLGVPARQYGQHRRRQCADGLQNAAWVSDLRRVKTGLGHAPTTRREGAPIPMKPLKRWDNGRDVVLAARGRRRRTVVRRRHLLRDGRR